MTWQDTLRFRWWLIWGKLRHPIRKWRAWRLARKWDLRHYRMQWRRTEGLTTCEDCDHAYRRTAEMILKEGDRCPKCKAIQLPF